MRNPYVERSQREGVLRIEPVLPEEDGGTGNRWNAGWGPYERDTDIDAGGETVEQALVRLVYGLGEELLRLRRDTA